MRLALGPADVWRRFRSLSEQSIAEGNLEAGEPVWILADAEGGFAIGRARGGADAVVCRFDATTGILTCVRRSCRSGAWALPLEHDVEDAVRRVLDELDWEGSEGK